MEWSPQQEKALQRIDGWLDEVDGPQVLRLFGYAGTGKTTLARTIADTIDGPVQFAAYTGKAASVMRAKGCATAQTLHSLVYSVDGFVDEEELELRALLGRTDDPAQRSKIVRQIRVVVANANKHRWIVNRDGPLADAALLILDECSMVDEKLGRDILSFNKPVLVLGDPGQLPPPTGAGFFTATAPDLLLTEVHRQAKENPIIRLATLAREGKPVKRGHVAHETGSATVTTDREAFRHFDGQFLTGSNLIRRTLNWSERCRALGTMTPPKAPQRGEPVIVLRNNKDLGIFNGVIGSMAADAVWTDEHEDLRGDVLYEGRLMPDLFIDGEVFRQYEDLTIPQPPLKYDRDKIPLDFGYALTVHKAQGSEWDSVCLVDDGFGRRDPALRAQWLYTAITRASKDLMIYTGNL